MMTRKVKQTVWQNSHAHRYLKKDLKSLPPFWQREGTICDEHLANDSTTVLYPAPVLKWFEDAIKRCPSVSISADIMEGQPCISGTRIPVRSVLRVIEQYGTVNDVKKCYPQLTIDQVEDALYFSQVILESPSGLDETEIAT
jgi:uncharacterized protein (DUF433 family)